MKPIEFNKFVSILGIVSLGIACFSIAYYYLFILPGINQDKLEFERQKYKDELYQETKKRLDIQEKERKSEEERIEKQSKLINCVNSAKGLRTDIRKSQCQNMKLNIGNGEMKYDENGICMLWTTYSSKVDDEIEKMINECRILFGDS